MSPTLVRLFSLYVRRYLGRHFDAVRISRGGHLPGVEDPPLVIYLNHPSWWDPLVGLQIARSLLAERSHFAAIDAAALTRYGFFRRLGFFGVEQGSRAGARTFLRVSRQVLALPRGTLWLTPQAEFSDPRSGDLRLAPGLAHLARTAPHCRFLPLALEYPFWDERLPEALARFGDPVPARELTSLPPDTVTLRLAQALAATQRDLAEEAIGRDPRAFRSLLQGRVGVGRIYDSWQAAVARVRGRPFDPAHASVVRASALGRRRRAS
ncbi:MAG: lysophospholipid acyltransferase family protein [Thermoanaerobaculia bacterium]|nr:lysophospholipid acyltransferase family protein [Thermoanaerobaculia bacterium]